MRTVENGTIGAWTRIDANGINYSNLAGIPVRNAWSGVHRGFVAEQLSWKNYGNNHTIFDASQGTSPDGTAVNNTNSQVAWTASYPTLMGWNGSNTYGVRVDVARYAESAGSAPGDNLGNHTATTTLNMNNNQITNFSYMQPYGVGGDSGQGNNAYGIFQEGGSWSSPYPDLRIAFHTGINLGANASYGGIGFYTDYDMGTLVMSINDAVTGAGANNVYMAGGLKAGSAYNINIPNSCGGNWATNCDLAIWTADHTGGCGDEAYIAHYIRTGEATTLEIGNKNDADDHIALMPSGNVGIGTTAPDQKLVVNGGNVDVTAGGGGLRLGSNNWSDGGSTYGHIVTDNGSYDALMIVGNNTAGDGHRNVRIWDHLNVEGTLTRGGNTVWDAANDGSGSSLDADLLDGNHASAFAASSHTHPWNQVTSKPSTWLDGATLIEDNADFNNSRPSGFYQYHNAANAPTGGTWYNMINVRHSNTGNDHGFQIAACYYDENIWTRTYQGGTGHNDGSFTPWIALIHTGNLSSNAILNQYSGAQSANMWISGETRTGGWFRSSSGSTGWYSEAYGGGIWMTDATWVRIYNGKNFITQSTQADYTAIVGEKQYDISGASYYDPVSGVKGYYNNPSYGDSYRFGTYGKFYHTYTDTWYGWRCGGVLGSYSDAGGDRGWGALAYNNSSGTFYGGYFTSYTSGAGYMNNNGSPEGIGSGSYGGLIGSWSRGEIMGHISSGELFADYNIGNTYTSGHHAEIVTVAEKRVATYSMTSTDVMVYKTGKGKLENGKATIYFDVDYQHLLASGTTPNVTITPIGDCKGIHIEWMKTDSFSVAENQGGNSNVEFTWIAIGERVDAESAKLPDDITDINFDNNMKKVMFNENLIGKNANHISWDGYQLRFETVNPKN